MTGSRRGNHSQAAAGGAPPTDGLAALEASIAEAWRLERAGHPDEAADDTAKRILADPSRHPWRLVDAAMDRLRCDKCRSPLDMGPVGCAACDLAHGFRFAAQEPDRPGVPAGNEHAIRVSSAVLRAPHRYPAWSVDANRAHLPLFLAGQMPTRREQEAMLIAMRRGVPVDWAGAETFTGLAARATEAVERAHRAG